MYMTSTNGEIYMSRIAVELFSQHNAYGTSFVWEGVGVGWEVSYQNIIYFARRILLVFCPKVAIEEEQKIYGEGCSPLAPHPGPYSYMTASLVLCFLFFQDCYRRQTHEDCPPLQGIYPGRIQQALLYHLGHDRLLHSQQTQYVRGRAHFSYKTTNWWGLSVTTMITTNQCLDPCRHADIEIEGLIMHQDSSFFQTSERECSSALTLYILKCPRIVRRV